MNEIISTLKSSNDYLKGGYIEGREWDNYIQKVYLIFRENINLNVYINNTNEIKLYNDIDQLLEKIYHPKIYFMI
jgi:hypothetical protein